MEIDLKQAQLHNMLCYPHQREEGFRKLMQMYGDKLYWHIRRIVVGHDDAEDVLQETCIKIISAIDTFVEKDSLPHGFTASLPMNRYAIYDDRPSCFKVSMH